ncbi:hypothetical protein [Kocuria massiliensis]|uniref:hypothetical protein n=1 Tax=Kocuria massiliensis TaxID=1926282 RepID=UPI000A1C7FC5|nr:hypothetical protein [Kocuria massiliensis]
MSIFNPIKNRLEKIEAELNAARPDQAPDFDEQDNRNKARNTALARGVPERILDDKEPALTDQQMQDWAEALTRSLEAKTVHRYIVDLHQQLTTARTFPIVTKTQVRRVPRLETQPRLLGLAEYKMNRGE